MSTDQNGAGDQDALADEWAAALAEQEPASKGAEALQSISPMLARRTSRSELLRGPSSQPALT